MTVKSLEKRVAALEAEIRDLKSKLGNRSPNTGSWLDLFGKYKDDPAFEEATRLGREWREQVNRESLEEFEREEQKAKAQKKKAGRKSKPRSANART